MKQVNKDNSILCKYYMEARSGFAENGGGGPYTM
jgi:hypothetical protein